MILISKDAISIVLSSGMSAKRKELTQPAYEHLEKTSYTSFLDRRTKKMPISGSVLQPKAWHFFASGTHGLTGSLSVIHNGFVHSGFQPNAQLVVNCTSEEEDCSPIAPPSTDATAAWSALHDSGDLPADVDLDDYIAADAEVMAHEELSDETVIENFHHSDASSVDDCDKQDLTAPSPAQKVMDAFGDPQFYWCS